MTKLKKNNWFIVRHAVVDYYPGRIYGSMDLDIKKNNTDDIIKYQSLAKQIPNCSHIVLSKLKRTFQTYQEISKYHDNLSKSKVLYDKRFNERNFGSFEDKPTKDLNLVEKAGINSIWLNPALRKPPNGESFFDLLSRVIDGFINVDKLISQNNQNLETENNILAVMHFGSIISLIAHALKVDPTQCLKISVENLSLTKLITDGDGEIILTKSITSTH